MCVCERTGPGTTGAGLVAGRHVSRSPPSAAAIRWRAVRAAPTRCLQAPTWTPDGRALVYADDRDGLLAVRGRDLATGEKTEPASGGEVHPALSLAGDRFASVDMSGNLAVRDPAAGTERTLGGAAHLPLRPV